MRKKRVIFGPISDLVLPKLDIESVILDRSIVTFFEIKILIYLNFVISFLFIIINTILNRLKPSVDTIPHQISKNQKKTLIFVR